MRVLDGIYDVAFRRRGFPYGENVQARPLVEEGMVAVMPASHARTRRATLNLSDLKDDHFILPPAKAGPVLLKEIRKVRHEAGLEPRLGQLPPDRIGNQSRPRRNRRFIRASFHELCCCGGQ
ncbi:LysR substrate-binding domain-containing protein [uncultured Bosea sp.]|uniref:LysR substrate-binding domain-containing protein n=1 Tax=uncultured Bosea sp. TaxID=211457 RepID=UPI00345BBD16